MTEGAVTLLWKGVQKLLCLSLYAIIVYLSVIFHDMHLDKLKTQSQVQSHGVQLKNIDVGGLMHNFAAV